MAAIKHLHILVRLEVKNPQALSVEDLKRWVADIISEQDMQVVIGPHVVDIRDEDNEGPTGGAHLKTSHMTFHIWERSKVIQADLYTCGCLDPAKFIKAFKVFSPYCGQIMVLDREGDIDILYRVYGYWDELLFEVLKMGRLPHES